MKSPLKSSRRRDIVILSGWLFADLLLALTVILLAAATSPLVNPPKPTPIVTVTQTPPRLENSPHILKLQVDYKGLLNNSPTATTDVKHQIMAQSFLKGRRAGFVIVFGGANNASQTNEARQVASKVIDIFRSLGTQEPAFDHTSYYDPLYQLGGNLSIVEVQIYLFVNQ